MKAIPKPRITSYNVCYTKLLRIKDGKAAGIVARGGHEIKSKTVVSAADTHQTFFKMVGEQHLGREFVHGLKRFKYRGSSAKVNLAVDRLPDFSCKPGGGPHLRGDITIAPGSYNFV